MVINNLVNAQVRASHHQEYELKGALRSGHPRETGRLRDRKSFHFANFSSKCFHHMLLLAVGGDMTPLIWTGKNWTQTATSSRNST